MPRGSVRHLITASPGGVRQDLNPAMIPDGSYLSSLNWITRNGEGRPRPGYAQVGSTLASADAVIGFGFRGPYSVAANLIVHTLTKAYNWDGAAFNDITGTWTTSTVSEPVRMTTFDSGGTLYLARVNSLNAIDIWNGTGNFASASGSPPAAVDITTCNGRLVMVNCDGDHDLVRLSGFNDIASYPTGASGEFYLTDTAGALVACRAFGPLSVGIYKDDAVYLGVAQASTAPFQFQYISDATGPVSAASVINQDGVHYWLGINGIIYSFDGQRVREISTGLATTARDTFDPTRKVEAHGFVLHTAQPELWWVYPSSAASTAIDRGVSVNLVTGAVNTHIFAQDITASAPWISQGSLTWNNVTGTYATIAATYPTWDSMASAANPTAVLGEDDGHVDQFGLALDDRSSAIAWALESPWRAIAGIDETFYVDGVRPYFKEAASSLTVTVGLTVTDTLGDEDTEQTGTIDIGDDDSARLVTFPNTRGRLAKVGLSGASQVADIAYRGTILLGWPRKSGT